MVSGIKAMLQNDRIPFSQHSDGPVTHFDAGDETESIGVLGALNALGLYQDELIYLEVDESGFEPSYLFMEEEEEEEQDD